MRRVETEGGSRLSLKLKPELHSLTAGEEEENSDLHFFFFFLDLSHEGGGGGWGEEIRVPKARDFNEQKVEVWRPPWQSVNVVTL